MSEEIIICRYGEISLKGKNRSVFENQLVRNMRQQLKEGTAAFSVEKKRGRIFVSTENSEETTTILKRVLGLTSISTAIRTNISLEEIKKEALNAAAKKKFSTFRVSANRCRKVLIPSMEIEKEIGAAIADSLNKKVSLKNFDLNINIELFEYAYIFTDKIECFGGLPRGIEGRVLAIMEDEASLLSAWLMMKRGCDVIPVSLDYLRKFEEKNMVVLSNYGCRNRLLSAKDFTEMDSIAEEKNCRAVVVNQTIKNFKDIESKFSILRPIIAFSQKDIEENLRMIRTG